MSIYQQQISIIKPAISPLQLVNTQQNFIDWQPQGGILMATTIVLYAQHLIVFYNRGSLMEKTWQIEVKQDIEEVKGSAGD